MTTTQRDHVLRAMTDDGAFRVMTIRSTDTVRGIIEAQRVDGAGATELGDVLTGAVLVRETMAPGNRAQIVLRDAAGSQLVGDAWPEGRTRGLAQLRDQTLGLQLGEGALLQVSRVMSRGMHQGAVDADEDIATALMTYFLQSEQITTMIALGTVIEDGEVRAAGGYVIQLLPEVTEPPLAIMTERLKTFGDVREHLVPHDADPALLLGELLYGFPHTKLSDSSVEFACHCSEDRALGAVAALGRDELEKIVADREVVPITCDYCRAEYRIAPEQVQSILDRTVDDADADASAES